MQSNPGSGNAVDKVLTVLTALPEHGGVAALAQATGLPKSTVHRILKSLVEHQFALDLGEGRYVGGPRILSLAGQVMTRSMPSQHVDPLLRALQQDTGFTVHLGMVAGDEAVYAAKVEGSKPYRMPSRVGMSVRLHCTGIGKAVLATMADEEVLAFADRAGLPGRTPNTLTRPKSLLAHLRQVRAQGYAVDDEENEQGIWCVAAAVRDHTGRTAGAVSVSTLVHEVEGEGLSASRLAPRVIAAAEAISTAFGAPQAPPLAPPQAAAPQPG